MAGRIVFWTLSFAAGFALGHFMEPEVRQKRLDAANLRARQARLARVQHTLLVSQLPE
jgi:hypothetical protein